MRSVRVAVVAVALALAGCAVVPPGPGPTPGALTPTGVATSPAPSPTPSAPVPRLYAEVVVAGLADPTDLAALPDGRALVVEKAGRLVLLSSLAPGATATRVHADLADVMATGDAGLTAIALAPDFARSRVFTTCQSHAEGGRGVDVRVVRWQLSADGTRADRVQELLTGIPLEASGQRSACRLAVTADGSLVVGTGDAGVPAAARSPLSLGGKLLRINPLTGQPSPDNPEASASGLPRFVLSAGHGAVGALAVRGDDLVVARSVDGLADEVVLVSPGSTAAEPVRVWSSGTPAPGLGGAAVLSGAEWGAWDGALVATGTAGGGTVVLASLSPGAVAATPDELRDAFGRLRAARFAGGALYVTTGNGADDKVIRVAPAVG